MKSYINAIDLAHKKHLEVQNLRAENSREILVFKDLVERCIAFSTGKGKDKVGNDDCKYPKVKEFVELVKVLTFNELCDFIRGKLENAEKLFSQSSSYYRSSDESEKQDKKIEYICTYIFVIKSVLCSNNAYDALCKNHINNCDRRTDEIFEELKNEVAVFLSSSSSAPHIELEALTEKADMPTEFPSETYLPIGKYDDKGVESLLSEGSRYEDSRFKKLIYDIARANRQRDALAVKYSPKSENGSILIHQKSYSVNERATDESDGDLALNELFESLVCRYLSIFPRISKRAAVLQKRSPCELEAFMQNIHKICPEFGFETESASSFGFKSNTEDVLRQLRFECQGINSLLNSNGGNLFEYNRKSYQNGVWKQMTLLIIKDYPLGFDERTLDNLKSILQNVETFGITVVMSVCDDLMEELRKRNSIDRYEEIFNYFDKRNVYDIDGYSLICRYSYEKVDFSDVVLHLDSFEKSEYFENLRTALECSRDPAIPLQSLIFGNLRSASIDKNDRRRSEFSKKLVFPIGRAGTDICNLELWQSGADSPHTVIAGTTGSGKSVLLQDIILSAMCHYTPDELELYLFDFKQTPEGFDQYENDFPHVKKIALQCKERDIFELLSMVKNQYEERMRLLDGLEYLGKKVSNISQYNAYARDMGLKQIPRVLVVIDEYQTITSEKCLQLLLDIAQKGRAYGVVLIMASQSSSVSSFGNIIKLFGNRFEFKNEQPGNLISGVTRRLPELNGPKGLCFFSSSGSSGTPVLVRCGYIDNDNADDMKQVSDYIKKKYGDIYLTSAYKVGGVKAIVREYRYSEENNGFLTLSEYSKDFSSERIKEEVIFDEERESESGWLEASRARFLNSSNREDRGFFLRLGLNSISLSPYEVTLDRQNPALLLCGDAQRIKNLEASVIKSVLTAAREARGENISDVIYYFDGKKQDGDKGALYLLDERAKGIKFFSPDTTISKMGIDELYREYQRRRCADSLSKFDPLVVVISELEKFLSVIDTEEGEDELDMSKDANLAEIMEFEEKYSSRYSEDGKLINPDTAVKKVRTEKKEISAIRKLEEMLSESGSSADIYFCLHLDGVTRAKYLTEKLGQTRISGLICAFKRNMFGSERDLGQTDIAISRMGYFVNTFMRDRKDRIKRSDININYAYKLENDRTVEFIPYEYSVCKEKRQ